MSTEIVENGNKTFSLAPQNIEEALKFAEMMSKSNLVPKEFSGNPGNILVAIQWGMELGLQPMQAMQNIAVINGRPSLWGDAVIALVRGSALCEYVYESLDGDVATCRVKRRGEEEQSRTFSMADAKAAGLSGKSGPWSQYPKRMLQLRARAFALRDVFPDVLRGMPVAEELMDMPKERDVTPAAAAIDAPKPLLSDAVFAEQSPKWKKGVHDGKKTVPDLIVWIEGKGAVLTEAQKQEIATWAPQTVEQEPEVIDDFVSEMNAAAGDA